MKVYVLTTGEYSDYTIHGIYSTAERAQEVHDLLVRQDFSYTVNDVFEWEVDEPALNSYWFRVFYYIDEDKIETYLIEGEYRCNNNKPSYDTYSKTFVYEIPYSPRLENEEVLRKVTYDRWAQFKAEQMEF